MARDLTAPMKAAIGVDGSAAFFLWAGYFDSGPLRLWTGYGDLPALGEVWHGSGDLGSAATVQETLAMRAPALRVGLSGLNPAIVDIARNEPYQGRRAEWYFGALEAPGRVIADPVLLFGGPMDQMVLEIGRETVSLALTMDSELTRLEVARGRRNTPEDHKADYADDTFFDWVADLQDTELVLI